MFPIGQEKLTGGKIRVNTMYLNRAETFTLAKSFKDFEELSAGQIIGTDGDEIIRAPDGGSIMFFPNNCTKKGEEAFLLGQYED